MTRIKMIIKKVVQMKVSMTEIILSDNALETLGYRLAKMEEDMQLQEVH